MDIRKIRKLISLMEESDLQELEVHEGEESIRLSRKLGSVRRTASSPSDTSEKNLSDDNN